MSKQRWISDRLISRYSDSGSSARVKLVGCDNDSEELGGKLHVFSAARSRRGGNNCTSAGNASFMFSKYKF